MLVFSGNLNHSKQRQGTLNLFLIGLFWWNTSDQSFLAFAFFSRHEIPMLFSSFGFRKRDWLWPARNLAGSNQALH